MYMINSFAIEKSIMEDNFFRVSISSFVLSIILAHFLVRGFFYIWIRIVYHASETV